MSGPVRTRLPFLLTLFTATATIGCTAELAPSDDGDASSEQTRSPLGKAEASGSCVSPDDGGLLCGDVGSNGLCWCDDLCATFGDCCLDKASACDDAPDLCGDFVGPCQSDDDCGAGSECIFDPDTCAPSACGCDPLTGHVICTEDCGGMECVPTAPGLCDDFVGPCSNDAECGEGFLCKFDPDTCSPSACGCDPDTGHVICTADCGGKECVPSEEPGGLCDDFVGPCNDDADCGDGFMCGFDPNTCAPSACGCDPVDGSIICTADCNGNECVPV